MPHRNIEQIDPNLKVDQKLTRTDIEWYDVRKAPFSVYGLHDPCDPATPFHRLPLDVAEQVSAGVRDLHFDTAGGRVRFATDSPLVCIRAVFGRPYYGFSHMPATATQGLDLYREDKATGREAYVATFVPPYDPHTEAFEGLANTQTEAMTAYTLNFPLYGSLRALYVGIRTGASLAAGRPYRDPRPVVFYGSSITQGGCASRPGNTYIAKFDQIYNINTCNLGFSGSAMGEETIARYIASLDMAAFVCDYDHNAPTAAHLANTLPRLYAAVRAAQPTLPFLFASAPTLPPNRAEQHAVVKATYEAALERGENVYYVDGWQTFAAADCAGDCTVDGTHPNDLGFYRMFKAFEPILLTALFEN